MQIHHLEIQLFNQCAFCLFWAILGFFSYSSVLYVCDILYYLALEAKESKIWLQMLKNSTGDIVKLILSCRIWRREQSMCIKAYSDSMTHKETKVDCMHKN